MTEQRDLAKRAVAEIAKPALDVFLSAMFDDKRLLDMLGNTAWTMGRQKVMQMPQTVRDHLKQYNGIERIVEAILLMVPGYLETMPEEQIQQAFEKMLPYCEDVVKLAGDGE